MPAAARALLFALCALAAPAHLQAATDQCSMETTATTNTFTLTAEPAYYKESTNYTVTVKGVSDADTFTALHLQAQDITKKTSSGEWMLDHESHHCPDSSLLYNTTSSKTFTAHWKSPSTAADSVEIRAFITETDGLKLISRTLTKDSSKESSTVTGTTKHPAAEDTHTTKTTHATPKPPSKTEGATTKKKPTQSTTAGSEIGAYSSCILIAIVQSVYLLFIGGRQ